MKRQSNATLIVIGIIVVLAIVVAIQQYSIGQRTKGMKSVREESMMQNTGSQTTTTTDVITGMMPESPTITADEVTGTVITGSISTGTSTNTVTPVIAAEAGCVTSYQALVDRAYGSTSTADAGQSLSQNVGLTYCNGATPTESDFLNIQSNGQTIKYTGASGGSLELDGTTINPDFTQNCEGTCPQVQAIRLVRSDNKYVVLETTQPRDYQSSFRLVSTSNGVTMLYWSVLNYVDPLVSYAWSKDGHFVFISTSGRETHTYVVQPKGFPNASAIAGETDTPIAVTVAGANVVILYDRDASNTSTTDRYTKSYVIADLVTTSSASGTTSSASGTTTTL